MNCKLLLSSVIGCFLSTMVFGQSSDNNSGSAASIHELNHEQTVTRHGVASFPAIVYASPMQFTENGLGFSFGYQKAIDKKGIIAYNLPLITTFNVSRGANNSKEYGGQQDVMGYFAPGILIYPDGGYEKTIMGFGPSMVLGYGQKSGSEDTGYPYYTSNNITRSKLILGVMLNGTYGINATERVYLAFDLGLGFTYLHMLDGVRQSTTGMAQGSFKIGYRL